MIEGPFGFEIFDFRDFFGYFFVWLDLSGNLSGICLGIQNNLKIRGSARESTTKLVLRLFSYVTHYVASVS